MIDLRQNGGGTARIFGSPESGLAARRKAIGRLYVLIGPSTFSAAVSNAIGLRELKATLVGETAGGTPNSHGELKFMTLPNSKLEVQFTSKYLRRGGADGLSELRPDLHAPRTLADFLAGRDAALERAIADGR